MKCYPCARNGPKRVGAPGRSRTCDPRLRRPVLYPLSYGRESMIMRSFSLFVLAALRLCDPNRRAQPRRRTKTRCKRDTSDSSMRPGMRTTLRGRSEEHTSELQSQSNLVCRLLLEKKKQK